MHSAAPAGNVAASNGMLLGVAGAGVVSLASGIFAALDDIRDARHERAYGDALSRAVAHARQMDVVVEEALRMISELKSENACLRRACQQRQDHIDRMRNPVAA